MKDEAERNRQRRHEEYINLQKSIFERIFTVHHEAQDNDQREAQDNNQREAQDTDQDDEGSYSE
jgi:hypothetical protein